MSYSSYWSTHLYFLLNSTLATTTFVHPADLLMANNSNKLYKYQIDFSFVHYVLVFQLKLSCFEIISLNLTMFMQFHFSLDVFNFTKHIWFTSFIIQEH